MSSFISKESKSISNSHTTGVGGKLTYSLTRLTPPGLGSPGLQGSFDNVLSQGSLFSVIILTTVSRY